LLRAIPWLARPRARRIFTAFRRAKNDFWPRFLTPQNTHASFDI
jgi:hypothetical protein